MEDRRKRRIMVDLDGVLVAFYEFVGLYLNLYEDRDPRNKGQLYSFMDSATEKFRMFRILPKKKDFTIAMNYLGRLIELGHTVEILSSIGNSKTRFMIAEDKNIWLDENLKGTPLEHVKRNLVEGSANKHKHLENPGDILIDDYIKPGKLWQVAGGKWVHHFNWIETVVQVDTILKK